VQQSYIASELCVYKDIAANTCRGKCYLKAHLQKQDSESDFSISYLKEKIDLYFNEYDFRTVIFYYQNKVTYQSIFYAILCQNNSDVFHPPA
jgi:hypothetical protein